MSEKNKNPKETKSVMSFSNHQINQHETNPDMVKLFKDFIRTYQTDISVIHEDFNDWIECRMLDKCDQCSEEKKCNKCLKIIKEEMKDRKSY